MIDQSRSLPTLLAAANDTLMIDEKSQIAMDARVLTYAMTAACDAIVAAAAAAVPLDGNVAAACARKA